MAACGVSKCGPATGRAVGVVVTDLCGIEAGVADPAVDGDAADVVGAGVVGAGFVGAGVVGAGGAMVLVGADIGGSVAFPPHPAAASRRARATAAVHGRR